MELFGADQCKNPGFCVNDELVKLGLLRPSVPVDDYFSSPAPQTNSIAMKPG